MFTPIVTRSLRHLPAFAWLGAALALTAAAPAHAAATRTLDVPGRTLHEYVAPAPHLPATLPTLSGSAGSWTLVGPNQLPGRFQCTATDPITPPRLMCGSDGCGYWTGDGLNPGGWTAAGDELGGGVTQMTVCLVPPSSGPAYNMVSVVRSDGTPWHSADGVTWAPDTLHLPDPDWTYRGTVQRMLKDGYFINVTYALVPATDPNGYDGFELLVSFDDGMNFWPRRFSYGANADLWVSRTDSRVICAWYDGSGTFTFEQSIDQGGSWTSLGTTTDPHYGSWVGTIAITAQESTNHVWLWEGNELQRSLDGGATWDVVRWTGELASPRALCASILNPDLIAWATVDSTCFSRDGGVTDSLVAQRDWPSSMHPVVTGIDCWSWNLGAPRRGAMLPRGGDAGARPAAAGQVNAPGDVEGLYFTTGSGVYLWQADASAPALLTNDGVITQQYSDLFTLRDTNPYPYDIVGATHDAGIMTTHGWGPAPGGTFWYGMIISQYLDVSNVVTSHRPTPGDPLAYGEFPNGFVTYFGAGSFTAYGFSAAYRHEPLTADPTTPYRYYFYDGGLNLQRADFNPANGVTTLTQASRPIDVVGTTILQLTAYAIAPSNPARRYGALENGEMWYSSDGGGTWTMGALTGTGPLPIELDNHQVRIAVNPANPLEAWAAGTSIVRTTDGGAHWTTQVAGLPAGANAWAIAYDGTAGAHVYLASSAGPFRWSGSAWTDLAPAGGAFPAVECRAVEGLPYLGVVRFGTWGRGVWDYATGITASAPAPHGAALALAVSGNPVRAHGRLDFSLPVAGHVTLELLDVAGRRVATLVNGVQPAGPGAADVDAGAFAAGIYFARLETAQGTRTARLVVIR